MISPDNIVNIIINLLYFNNIIKEPLLCCVLAKKYIELYTNYKVYINKGFIIYNNKFGIHFWLEYENQINDCANYLLLFFPNIKKYKITKELPIGENIYSDNREKKINDNYIKYLKNIYYNEIKNKYNNLLDDIDNELFYLK